MLRDRATRRVATVLFVDVVDSTRVAAEVGDARWRELVAAFRSIVRRRLKRLGGHEVDTAGDGFFATFDSPASALRAAAAIVADVQSIGLDVRCGLHTGELERIDGRLGGIAAHIGARVMAQANAAQVLTTGTVRDLVVGGSMTFEAAGETELKGVPGVWALHRLSAADGDALPAPLSAGHATSRRAAGGASANRRRPLLLAGSAAAVVVVGVAILVATGQDPGGAATSSTPPSEGAGARPDASPAPTTPIALVRIDPGLRAIDASGVVYGDYPGPWFQTVMMADGNLWHWDEAEGVVTRLDAMTGAPMTEIAEIELPPLTTVVRPAFGYLWVQHGRDQPMAKIDKYDPGSGRMVAQVDPGERVWDLTIGERAIYVPTHDGELLEIDPDIAEIVDRDPAGTATPPVYVSWWEGLISLCECGANRYSLFDPVTDRIVGTLEGPALAYGGGGARDPQTGTVWVGDRPRSTITPYHGDPLTSGEPLGLDAHPRAFAFGFNAVWVAAEEYVYRIDADTRQETDRIPMPEGAIATSLALDEQTDTIWVAACHEDCYEDD